MLAVYSDDHKLHEGKHEFYLGELITPFDHPSRLESIVKSLADSASCKIIPPSKFGLEPILRVHTPEYVDFLKNAFNDWRKGYGEMDAFPIAWPTRAMRQTMPNDISGKLGYYSFDSVTPITAGTWQAIISSANVALTGVELIGDNQRSAFSICRPPGHHASQDQYGGFCFFNNASIATEAFVENGAKRVAILDIDYHHGNGTQKIFYDRSDVLFLSIHADPSMDFPYYLGYASETGTGEGEGYNMNYPLPWGTTWQYYKEVLNQAAKKIQSFSPDILVVSLGVDTFEKDPLSQFKLISENFSSMGQMIGRLSLPTHFIMEGGYAIDEIGINVNNLITGFTAVS